MSKRLLFLFFFLAAGLGGFGTWVSPALAATVKAYLFPLTGEIRLFNPDPNNAFPLVLDEIYYDDAVPALPAGGLNPDPSVWKAIAGNYDVNGNGFIDPVNAWQRAQMSNSKHLAEGLLVGTGSAIPPLRSISLGRIWNSSIVLPDKLKVHILETATVDANVLKEVAVDGDYFPDFTVNASDYNSWKNFFGKPYTGIADGNINGIVDAADYTVWRDNLGATLVGTPFIGSGNGGGGSGGLSVSPVPEPASCALAISCCALMWRCRRARRSRHAA